ncbi:hypothetical protein LCGC14_2328990 [marine sediment metagenome]|uniref:NIPSNAP domain-containing protein n=1 Tax=marine sediment metagenome TaxID=412755 RepID=A0A0F9ET33_9ZZZZ
MNTITPSHGELQRYRIYFEPVEPIKSLELLQNQFAAATVTHGEGLWISGFEKTTVFEIFSTMEEGYIEAFAEALRALNHQHSVIFTVEPVRLREVKSASNNVHAQAPDVSYPLA